MKKKYYVFFVLLVFVVSGIVLGRLEREPAAEDCLTLFGNVEIRKVNLGFLVAGRLAEVNFQEGERVRAGQIIARLERTPYLDGLNLALAQQEQAAANLEKMEAGNRPQEIAQAEALVRERQATLSNLETEYQRLKNLVEDGAVSRQNFDNISSHRVEAKARLATAKEGLNLVRAGFRSEDIDAARADLRAAQARSASARNRLEDTLCKAPDNGTILTRVEEPGAIVGSGQTVLTLSLDSPLWIRAYIGEPELGLIHPGMAAKIYTDSRPQEPFVGHVGFISPEAEFTPKTVQTEELRTQLVYQVRIIAENPGYGLRQGMPVTVKLAEAERQNRSE